MGEKFKSGPEEPKDWGPTTGYFQGERQGNAKLGKEGDTELLRERVESALMVSNMVDASDITVGANGDSVILEGSVPDQEMCDSAVALASGVPGVREVINQLTVVQNRKAG